MDRRDRRDRNVEQRVKNKLPAPVQVTAEQLLREASERLGGELGPKRFHLGQGMDRQEYFLRERTKFEEAIRRSGRGNVSVFLKYAKWEEEQSEEMGRVRSIYERALAADPYSIPTWQRYAEAEMRKGNGNLARNVWDRAVTVLPRVDAFWFKRISLEEVVGDVAAARQVWERWMRWEPSQDGVYKSFVKFEERHGEWGRARRVWERVLQMDRFQADASVWQALARFEELSAADRVDVADFKSVKLRDLRVMRARAVWERSLQFVASEDSSHLVEFAKFEARHSEVERARFIYRFAMQHFPDSDTLRHSYVSFEKQHGDPSNVGSVVLFGRRGEYERRVSDTPYDYDAWLDLIGLEEDLLDGLAEPEAISQQADRVRDAYERAISKVPVVHEKKYWQRYVYLWLFYAIFEERSMNDVGRAEQVLKTCLRLVPHRSFSFAKVWAATARLCIRTGDLKAARLTLGNAIGRCPKPRLFAEYLSLEVSLREFDRCRVLYEKWIEHDPSSSSVWIKYAELERLLLEDERARAIYELAIEEPSLDCPELIWKAFIDWECEEEKWDGARDLYERLLLRTQHVKVWVSFANMELSIPGDQPSASVRAIMQRGYEALEGSNDERLLLLEAWEELELMQGCEQFARDLHSTHWPVVDGDVWTWPVLFREDANNQKLLELAKKWKSDN